MYDNKMKIFPTNNSYKNFNQSNTQYQHQTTNKTQK